MRPYFDSHGIKIYHGDCREILPRLRGIDAVVCDPPYSSGGFTETAKRAAKGMGLRHDTIKSIGWFACDNMTSAGAAWLMAHVAGWCARMLPAGGTFTACTDWRMLPGLAPAIESAGLRYQNLIVWDKGHAGLGHGFRAQHELAMHFSKGVPRYFDKTCGNVIQAPRVHASRRRHQTQKPPELIERIVRVVAPPAGRVADPFMGSGSTLVGALRQGRRAVGIELDERNCETAALWLVDEITRAGA